MHTSITTLVHFLRPRGFRHWVSTALVILSWVCQGFSLTFLAILVGGSAFALWAYPYVRDMREQQAGPAPVDPWQRFWHWSCGTAWLLSWVFVVTWINNYATPWRGLVVTIPYACYVYGFLLAVARLRVPGGSLRTSGFLQPESPQRLVIPLPSRAFLTRAALYGQLGTSAVAFMIGMFVIALTPPA